LTTVTLGEGLEEIGESAFKYTSLESIVIPNAIRTIERQVFSGCTRMTNITLGDGVEEIEKFAFINCESLERVVIPPAVKRIAYGAFCRCWMMTSLTLSDGLEEIGVGGFSGCISLQRIIIPNAIKKIKKKVFNNSTGLTTVTLCDGLEKIEGRAFNGCTTLEHIKIPRSVKRIHQKAFRQCPNLTSGEFCHEIEAFVSCNAMRYWWNHGVHHRCLATYCFLVKHDIPNRLSLVRVRSWRAKLYDMLSRIPTIHPDGVNIFFHSIESKLTLYENLKDHPALLELAIWKSKISDQHDHSDDHIMTNLTKKRRTDSVSRTQFRNESLNMVMIIVPIVFSFLTDGNGGNGIADDTHENIGDDYNYNDSHDDSSDDDEISFGANDGEESEDEEESDHSYRSESSSGDDGWYNYNDGDNDTNDSLDFKDDDDSYHSENNSGDEGL
jgi:hypothetical protein